MASPTREQVSLLRWAAILAGVLLFVSDYGFDVWAKPVPQLAYWVVGAIAVGIEVPQLRTLLLTFLEGLSGKNGK